VRLSHEETVSSGMRARASSTELHPVFHRSKVHVVLNSNPAPQYPGQVYGREFEEGPRDAVISPSGSGVLWIGLW
jgi:hypothetical protein